MLLNIATCCYMLLHVATCWLLLNVATCCYVLLHVTSYCYMLLQVTIKDKDEMSDNNNKKYEFKLPDGEENIL